MPQPNKIPKAFAASGDRNIIPESTGTLGLASWNEGFPAITSVPFSEGGLAPKRADFNGVFNALSAATVWQQQGGLWAYDNTTDYEVGNVVFYNGGLYKCITANGPSSAVKSPIDATVWDAIISASGGILTGNIVFSQSTGRIFKKDSTGDLRLFGGTSFFNGASFSLTGTDSLSGGLFSVTAHNGTNSMEFIGRADGRLTWGGKSLVNNGAFNAMFFSQTSGSYTAPYTGVYRITLKGGGGGGGGRNTQRIYTGGSGGGEGATLIFYVTLTKNRSYSYTIGAGGSAGADGTGGQTSGGSGGGTSFTLSGTESYQSNGGGGGRNSGYSVKPGGRGGDSYAAPSGAVCHFIPGAPGMPGAGISAGSNLTDFVFYAAMGGGSGGGCAVSGQNAIYGGGGGGAAGATDTPPLAQNGGDGYILIEYAE